MHKCQQCSQNFDNERGLLIHTAKMHKKVLAPLKPEKKKAAPAASFCPNCGLHLQAVNLALAVASGLVKQKGG